MPEIATVTISSGEFTPHAYHQLLDKPSNFIQQELATKGYGVVKQAIPVDRALAYRERAFDWLEGFGLGFDRNNEATWIADHLPSHFKGGMFSSHIYHESWVWDIRQEPGVIAAFAELWQTHKLTTSFDGAGVFLPRRTDLPSPSDADKWAHRSESQAQRVLRRSSIVNLNHCGPDDGGLLILEGSSQLMETYFDEHPNERDQYQTWGPVDWCGFTALQQEWFYERGCSWKKVEANPGDLILWDSRGMHYNRRPSTNGRDRVCTYVCMAPDELMDDEAREVKRQLFVTRGATTHNPFENIYPRPREEGKPQNPVLEASNAILRLAAMKSYDD